MRRFIAALACTTALLPAAPAAAATPPYDCVAPGDGAPSGYERVTCIRDWLGL